MQNAQYDRCTVHITTAVQIHSTTDAYQYSCTVYSSSNTHTSSIIYTVSIHLPPRSPIRLELSPRVPASPQGMCNLHAECPARRASFLNPAHDRHSAASHRHSDINTSYLSHPHRPPPSTPSSKVPATALNASLAPKNLPPLSDCHVDRHLGLPAPQG